MRLNKPLTEIFTDIKIADICTLTISNSHLLEYQKVPFPEDHRDPFDRLIIATAIAESAAIISADQKFNNYSDLVKIIW